MAPNDGHGDGPTSQLVIPYWTGDDGNQRPLPNTVVSWACPSIVVTSGPFVPGQPLMAQVTVANYGLGTFTSLVDLRVYWASASTGLAVLNTFGSPQSLPVPTHGASRQSLAITDTIPASAGPHCCLIASVKFLDDAPGVVPDVANDRHWAQLNLFAPAVASDGTFRFGFWAGNPLRERAQFELVARPLGEAGLAALERRFRAEGSATNRIELALDAAGTGHESQRDSRWAMELDLQPGQRTAIGLHGRLLEDLQGEGFAAVEVEQSLRDASGRSRTIGTLGLVLTKGRDHC